MCAYEQTDLDCTLTSRQLCQLTDDKVRMRVLISDKCKGSVVQVPRTLAFVCQTAMTVMTGDRSSSNVNGASNIANGTDVKRENGHDNINEHVKIVHLMASAHDDVSELMRSSISTFVNSLPAQRYSRVRDLSHLKLHQKDFGFRSFHCAAFVR
jgi:hypothetical protein